MSRRLTFASLFAVSSLFAGGLVPASTTAAASGAAAISAPKAAVIGGGSWTVYHHDDAHSGSDPSQPQATGAVAGWTSATLDGDVYGEVLVYSGLVYAATLNNTVYAFDQSTGAQVWSHHLRAPVTTGWSCGNVSPQGILGTPVIDSTTGRIYVTTLGSDHVYRVEGLNLADGTESLDTAIPTNLGPGFDWTIEQERGALVVANGDVYVPFGGRWGDCGNYHGWVFAVPTNGGAVTNYYVTPGNGAGFWGAGGLVVDDTTGDVFATSGNGVGSGCAANSNGTPTYENDAVVRLSPTLAHQDSFVPNDWQKDWCGNDQDLGSAGPTLISPSILFQSGKWGTGFLLNPSSLGGMDGQLFPTPKPAAYSEAPVCFGNHSDATFGSFAYAAPFIYVECEGHGVVALSTNTTTPSFSPCDATCSAPDWHAGGTTTFGPPIVAGGAVWVVDTGGGGLSAFNATTGALIYHSASFNVDHFVTPAEAGGQVFVGAKTVVRSFSFATGVTLTPSALSFGGQAPGTTSSPLTVTLHNNLSVALNVTSATLSGPNAGNYLKGTDGCSGVSVAAGGTCTVQVSLHPGGFGGFPATLSFVDSAPGSPQSEPLNGMGALDDQGHLYTLDGYGGVHPDGTAPALSSSAYWPGWNIARSIGLFPDGTGGYVLDGYGGLHPLGSAPTLSGYAYWPGFDIARQVVLAPWSSSASPAGWTLDGYGGIHPFGGAPAVGAFAYWPGWDIARGLAILPDSTPSGVAGYTLDGYGGLHPFGGAPALNNFASWSGWDIARGVTLSPDASRANVAGWTLDGWGGVHPFGTAPAVAQSASWRGWDIARGIVAWTGSGVGGWVLDGYGGIHTFGASAAVSPFAYWPGWDIATSLSGPACNSGSRRRT